MGKRDKQKSHITPEKILRALLLNNFKVVSTHARPLPEDRQLWRAWLTHTNGMITLRGQNRTGQEVDVFFTHGKQTPSAVKTIADKTGVSFGNITP